ncbi:MAG: hypothetical protein ACLQO7_06225 [Candidatus Bathyarchaeia archaeon]
MSKINPGSNFNEDNDIKTARPGGMQDIDIKEPKIDSEGKLHCTICDKVFNSRQDYVSHALSKHQQQTSKTVHAQKFLATVSYDHGFHFYTSIGIYTGETAVNLTTFAKELGVVPIECVDFHFKRADFQKWITDTIGDNELATAIGEVEMELAGEPLRLMLLSIVIARVKELENQS